MFNQIVLKRLLQLVAFIFNGKVVWLRDFDGEISYSIAYEEKYTTGIYAKRYWPWKITKCYLIENGTVQGINYKTKEKVTYVKSWGYAVL